MTKEYYVSTPSAFLYLLDNKKCEVTDELLYGTKLISEQDKTEELMLVKTDYGYSGWIEGDKIKHKEHSNNTKKYIIIQNCLHFLLRYPPQTANYNE